MKQPAVEAYIGVGANLGDARAQVIWAIEQVSAQSGIVLLASSPLYRSAPVDASGDDFCNAVLKLSANMSAYTLLEMLQNIEQSAGRVRPYPNAPRTLDLDLLLYGSGFIQSPTLTVPHPRMAARAFVLKPLQRLAPELVSDAAIAAVAHQRCELW